MSSLRHRLLWSLLRVTRFRFRMGKDLARGKALRTSPKGALARRYRRETFDGFPIWRISPKGQKRGTTPKSVLYHLHGGGHVYGLLPIHFLTLAKLADAAKAEIVVPCYPLPTERTGLEIIDWCDRHFETLVQDIGMEPLCLSGDSAGAQLALQVALLRRARGAPCPKSLILWSPWVDLSMENPEVALGKGAAVLEPKALQKAGQRFAGALDPKDPLISPLFADLTGLPELHVFTGGRDMLYPDILKFCERAVGQGVTVHLIEERALGHYWMFLPVPEAKITWAQTADILTAYSGGSHL